MHAIADVAEIVVVRAGVWQHLPGLGLRLGDREAAQRGQLLGRQEPLRRTQPPIRGIPGDCRQYPFMGTPWSGLRVVP
eukprot:11228364-Lingulodinium_polyedra.AAC.6